MREALPFSFFGTISSHEYSFLRRTKRSTLMPHVWRSALAKRSCDSGMRISADQPCSSADTCDCHTASQVPSHQLSL